MAAAKVTPCGEGETLYVEGGTYAAEATITVESVGGKGQDLLLATN